MRGYFDSRTNNLNFIRFTLATLVIYAHSYALLAGSDDPEPLMRLTGGQMTFGALAVNFFFVVSGFLITHSYLNSRGPWVYLSKRVRRIHPGFIAASVVSALVVAPLATPPGFEPVTPVAGAVRGSPWSVEHVVDVLVDAVTLHYQEVPGPFAGNPFPGVVNGSLWTIKYEFWCYIGIMLLGLTGLLRQRLFILAAFAASVVIGVAFLVLDARPGAGFLGPIFGSPRLWSRLLPYYLAGTAFYLYRDSIPVSRALLAVGAAALVVGAVVPHGMAAVMPVFGTYILFVLAFAPSRLSAFGRSADFSYGIYLYAFPIQQALVALLGREVHPLVLFACSMPPSVLAGAVSWHLVEKHFLRRRQARITMTPAEGADPLTWAAPGEATAAPVPREAAVEQPAGERR